MDSVAVGAGVQTIDRAISVIEAVAARGPLGLAGLVEVTGLARPTAHRIARALEDHGILRRDAEGRFALGARLAALGALATRGLGLAERAPAVLAQLRDATGESAQLYVREGDQRVCVAVAERASGLRDTVPLGAVLPLERGSGGKVLLAWSDDADRFGVDAAELARVRTRGHARSVAEREAGVASVSAPVRDAAGSVVGAVSVSGPADRFGRDASRRLAAAVCVAAEALSA